MINLDSVMRKEIFTIMGLLLVGAIIWTITSCTKSDYMEKSLKRSEQSIRKSIDEKDILWFDGEYGALSGGIASDIKVTNYQKRDITLDEVDTLFKNNWKKYWIKDDILYKKVLEYAHENYYYTNASVDVSFTVQYFGKSTRKFKWTCYLSYFDYKLFYCHLHKE